MDIVKILYPDIAHLSDTEITVDAWDLKFELQYGVLRRLCWLGLLLRQEKGSACLTTEPSTKHRSGQLACNWSRIRKAISASIDALYSGAGCLNKACSRRAMTAGSLM